MSQVVWVQIALNELTVIWTNADPMLRKQITAATHIIDKELQSNPQDSGESREADHRILISMPRGVSFRVQVENNLVEVFHVWLIRPRKRP